MKKKELTIFAKQIAHILPQILAAFTKRLKNELTKGNISLPQLTILEYLNIKGTCIMSDIAKLISVTMSGATGLTDRMIKNKYLTRMRDRKDRRIVKVRITPKGRKVARFIMRHRVNMIENMFVKLSNADRKSYLEILQKVHKNLSTQRK